MYLQPFGGVKGRVSAIHKVMNLELDMILFNHSAKKVHVLINGIAQFLSSWCYMGTLKKPQTIYPELSSYLG